MMVNGNIIFFGTSSICLPFLEKIYQHFQLSLIVTQPDSRGGRNNQVIVPAVKKFALKKNIEYLQPTDINEPTLFNKIQHLNPDLGVVIAFGKRIPRKIFSIPKYQIINVHFSILPLYRGGAPVQRAIENGEKTTGITVFEIAEKMDCGDIWAQSEFPILPQDTSETLFHRLTEAGVDLLIQSIENIFQQKIQKQPQLECRATQAQLINKKEGEVDWSLPAIQIYNKYRAFQPWPRIFFFLNQKLIRINKIELWHPPECQENSLPGTILSLTPEGMVISCGNSTCLRILEIQPEGKKSMTPYTFSLGNTLPQKLV